MSRRRDRTLREAEQVARLYGAKPNSSPLEKAEALLRGLKASRATRRQIKQGEAIVEDMRVALKKTDARNELIKQLKASVGVK